MRKLQPGSRARRSHSQRVSWILLGAMLFLLLSGTAMQEPPVANSATPPTLNGKPLPEYAAPSGGLVAEIKQRGVIQNGMEAQNPPFEYIENGHIVGYDADLVERLAQKLGVKAQDIDTAWSGVIPSLYTRKFDLIWSAMTITAPRKEAVNFSAPYGSDQAVILVRKGDGRIKSIQDLTGKILGTQLNSAAELQAKELETKYGIKYRDLKSYDHFDGAYLDLVNGNIDAATSTKLNDIALFKNKPDTYVEAVDLPFFNYVAVATRKPDTDLAKVVDDLLTELTKSGELAKLQKKWFGFVMDLNPK